MLSRQAASTQPSPCSRVVVLVQDVITHAFMSGFALRGTLRDVCGRSDFLSSMAKFSVVENSNSSLWYSLG